MGNVYRTARGEAVDMDLLRLSNENVIAVGNMRTNARGDELGPGGKVVKTRAQIMAEYHKLDTPPVSKQPPAPSGRKNNIKPVQAQDENKVDPVVQVDEPDFGPEPDAPVESLIKQAEPVSFIPPAPAESAPTADTYVKPRGSFAEAIAEETEVKQELLEPINTRRSNTSNGPQRI
jgi:hypothetical protein